MQPANGQNDQAVEEGVDVSKDPTAKGGVQSGQGLPGDNGTGVLNETEIAVVSTSSRLATPAVAVQPEEPEPSAGPRIHISKKRQRDETKEGQLSPRDRRLAVESSDIGKPSAAARESSAGGGYEEVGFGKGMKRVAEGRAREKACGEGRDVCRDALKPLLDPKVKEVVSQDLATEEIRRVRRKDSDPSRPSLPFLHQARAADGARSAWNEKRAALLPNGEAPPPPRYQENGKDGRSQAATAVETSGGERGAPGTQSEPGAPAAIAPPELGKAREGEGKEGERARLSGIDTKPNGVISSKKPVEPPPSSVGELAASALATPTAEAIPGRFSGGWCNSAWMSRPFPEKLAQEDPTSPERGIGAGSSDGEATETTGNCRGDGSSSKPKRLEDEEDQGLWRKEETSAKGVSEEGLEKERGRGKRQKGPRCPEHALPVARAFFDYDSVSAFEMRTLPEFFTGRSASKTAEMYIQSRNYMVRSYQRMLETDRNGQAYMTGTECRRKLAGDVCSILRIHDFLDRFGLINTRTGGRRPPSFPVLPPSVHLWNPTLAGPGHPFRSTKGIRGGKARGREQEPGSSVATGPAGGEGFAGWGSGYTVQARRRDAPDSGNREWHRKELVRLMEAAVATPDQWETVAFQVGGGRTPTACMRQFLNLAVEEVLGEQNEQGPATGRGATSEAWVSKIGTLPDGDSEGFAENPAQKGADGGAVKSIAPSLSLMRQDTPPQGGKAAAESTHVGVGSTSGKGGTESYSDIGEAVASAGTGFITGADVDVDKDSHRRECRTPLGQNAPALMLASALVSSVHPEVLRAAASAAAVAAEDVARRWDASSKCEITAALVDSGRGGSLLEASRIAESSMGPRNEDVIMLEATAREPGVELGQARRDLDATSNGKSKRSSETHAAAPWALKRGIGRLDEVERRISRAAAARAAVLSVAGLQARGLAEQEDRRTEALIADLLEARLQRLETKLHCLDELDQVLEAERQSLEHDRAELLANQAQSMLSK